MGGDGMGQLTPGQPVEPGGAVFQAGVIERSLRQCLQKIAASWISSAQYGHFLTTRILSRPSSARKRCELLDR